MQLTSLFKINLKGDLFATGFTFGAQMLMRLGSSLVLTRILAPEAYGIITILLSATYIIEMISDIGVTVPIIRSKYGDDQRYLDTAWTLRLIRACINTLIVLIGAPLIASLYGTHLLVTPLRLFSLYFLINGLETMAFATAVRRKNSRVLMYCELLASALSSAFAVAFCYYRRDYWGILLAILLNRVLVTLLSYCFYRHTRPRLRIDRAAARDLFSYTRFAMPSSVLTLALSQFDRIVFLRLFDLKLLGIYGLAGNLASAVESLISKVSQMVLYPRCAHNYLADRSTFTIKYYTENARLFVLILALPAAVGGAGRLIIHTLYDPRYAMAGAILQAFMLRAALLALSSPAEDMLIATGESHIILVGNVFRAAWLFAAALIGYKLFGLLGFVYGMSLSGLPPLLYYFWLQRRKGMMVVRYEIYKLGYVAGLAACAYFGSSVVMNMYPTLRIHFHP